MGHVYKITNTITQDEYIGKSKEIKRRWNRHKQLARTDGQTYLYRAMRKYGINNFKLSIIEECSPDILNEREMYWIKERQPLYNMTEGGDGGNTADSPNYKSAIKLYHANKLPESYATYGMLGKKQSQKQKDAISKRNSCRVVVHGVEYSSVKKAQEANPGISVRKRIESRHHPDCYRIDPKKKFPRQKAV